MKVTCPTCGLEATVIAGGGLKTRSDCPERKDGRPMQCVSMELVLAPAQRAWGR
jgi:hypothetical protein